MKFGSLFTKPFRKQTGQCEEDDTPRSSIDQIKGMVMLGSGSGSGLRSPPPAQLTVSCCFCRRRGRGRIRADSGAPTHTRAARWHRWCCSRASSSPHPTCRSTLCRWLPSVPCGCRPCKSSSQCAACCAIFEGTGGGGASGCTPTRWNSKRSTDSPAEQRLF